MPLRRLTAIILLADSGQYSLSQKTVSSYKRSIMIGKLNADEVDQVLQSQLIGRIGCHANGVTYIVPTSYAYDGKYIYVHTREGMKLNIMRENPDVCFETDSMENMANWKSVIAWGRFEEVMEKDMRDIALQKLLDRILPVVSSETTHLFPDWPFPPSDLSEIKGVVFRIHLTKKTGRFEKNTDYMAAQIYNK